MTKSSVPSSLQSRLHKHEQFASRLIDEKHDFIVYVPQAFNDDPNRFFPVLYLHDGQNLFDPETSFIKGNYWRVGETADALIARGRGRTAGDRRGFTTPGSSASTSTLPWKISA